MTKKQIESLFVNKDDDGNVILNKADTDRVRSGLTDLTGYQQICSLEELKILCKFPPRKLLVLQYRNERVTFKKQEDGSFEVTTEESLGTGGTIQGRIVTREQAGFLLIRYKLRGFAEFRTEKEVSWYATMRNNTPYEEKWEVVNGIFIPVCSHSAGTDGNNQK